MTDSNGIFAHDDAYRSDEEGGRDKRTVLVAGGLAALVLGAGAFFFLGSGSDEADTVAAPSAAAAANAKARAAKAAAAATGTTPKAAAAKAPAVVPAESTFAVGRNPFTALYVAPVAAAASSTPATTPATPVTTTPTTGATTYVPPVTTTTTAPKPTTPAVVLHELVLQTVSEGSSSAKTLGTFLIDKKKYVVPVGQVFGPKSELVVVAYQQDAQGTWTAVLRVGDSAPFDAAQGDELNVM